MYFSDEMELDKVPSATYLCSGTNTNDIPHLVWEILTKRTLPMATVVGFTRYSSELIKYLLSWRQGVEEVFSIKDLDPLEVIYLINTATERNEKRQAIMRQLKSIPAELQQHMLFVKEIIQQQHSGIVEIFLSIILKNLQYQNPNGNVTHFNYLKYEDTRYLIKLFNLCKDNSSASFMGGRTEGGGWKCCETRKVFPLKFLKAIGVFEIIPLGPLGVNLTPQHPSFIQFLSAVGIYNTPNSNLR